MQVQWYHEVVGTLKPYHMLKNLFELIALNDDGVEQLWVQLLTTTVSACTHAHEPPGETFTI